jgi:hypothetical protein
MEDSSSSELLDEIKGKRAKLRILPISLIVLSVACVCLFVGADHVPWWGFIGFFVAAITAITLASYLDKNRKTVVIFYDLESKAASAFCGVLEALSALRECGRVRHITAQGASEDPKYHAGAGTLVKYQGVTISTSKVPFLVTNLDIPRMVLGKLELVFLPDRLVVLQADEVGAVQYADLSLDIRQVRFIESDSVPSDAQVVDQTWQFVNKKGGPDRRFSNNRQLPVALYEEIGFRSSSGLNELVQASKVGTGEVLRSAIAWMSTADEIPSPPPVLGTR